MIKSPKRTPLNPAKIERLKSETFAFLKSREKELTIFGKDDTNAICMKYKLVLMMEFIGLTFTNDLGDGEKIKYLPLLNGSSDYILEQVNESPYAYQAVAHTIIKIIEEDLTVPEKLKPYATGVLLGSIKQPKHSHRPNVNWWCDLYICIAIFRLQEEGLPVFSQNDYVGETAVSIVESELNKINIHLSGSALNTIWKNKPYPSR